MCSNSFMWQMDQPNRPSFWQLWTLDCYSQAASPCSAKSLNLQPILVTSSASQLLLFIVAVSSKGMQLCIRFLPWFLTCEAGRIAFWIPKAILKIISDLQILVAVQLWDRSLKLHCFQLGASSESALGKPNFMPSVVALWVGVQAWVKLGAFFQRI